MRIRSLLLIPVATAAIYSCGHADPEPPAGYDDVELAGKVTDETLAAFVSALDQGTPAAVPSQAATLDAPTNDALIPRATVPTFTWHIGASSMRSAPPASSDTPPGRWASLDLFPSHVDAALRVSTALPRELFGPARRAYAHGDPFTGTATYLVFSVDSDPKLVRVFTNETSYTPSKAAWDKLLGAGKPITLTLTSAIFEQNRVLQDGGPFAGSSIKFTVAP